MLFHAEVTGIVVTDTKLFNRTGDVGRWAEKVNLAFVRHALAEAPVSSGEGQRRWPARAQTSIYPGALRDSIEGEVVRVGPRQLQTTVSVNVFYALYVIKGTGTIFSKTARIPAGEPGAGQFQELEGGQQGGMRLPSQPWIGAITRQRVRGQSPNNFLGRAFDATARTHSSLRGYSMGG
jgi:hypothetical protein